MRLQKEERLPRCIQSRIQSPPQPGGMATSWPFYELVQDAQTAIPDCLARLPMELYSAQLLPAGDARDTGKLAIPWITVTLADKVLCETLHLDVHEMRLAVAGVPGSSKHVRRGWICGGSFHTVDDERRCRRPSHAGGGALWQMHRVRHSPATTEAGRINRSGDGRVAGSWSGCWERDAVVSCGCFTVHQLGTARCPACGI